MAEPALTAAPLVGDQEQQQQSQSPAHQQQQAAAGQRLVGRWALSTHIGAGSFAIVWRARHVDTGAEAAVKEINLSKLNSKLRQSLESEVSILKRVRHENIVTLLEVVEVRPGPSLHSLHPSRWQCPLLACRGTVDVVLCVCWSCSPCAPPGLCAAWGVQCS